MKLEFVNHGTAFAFVNGVRYYCSLGQTKDVGGFYFTCHNHESGERVYRTGEHDSEQSALDDLKSFLEKQP